MLLRKFSNVHVVQFLWHLFEFTLEMLLQNFVVHVLGFVQFLLEFLRSYAGPFEHS